MNGVTVLSPHRDDAVFSLFDFLSRVASFGVQVTVYNFFTVSSYGPHAGSDDPQLVSAIRRREDRQALKSISSNINVIDCDFLDAPLRLRIPLAAVCNQDATEASSQPIISQLIAEMRIAADDLVLAPLGLGNHVDHLAVHEAAIKSSRAVRLGFYEDLPYAIWTSPQKVHGRVQDTERNAQVRLRPLRVPFGVSRSRKRRAAEHYRSQVTLSEAAAIAQWGERIWLPHTSAWLRLLGKMKK